METDIPAAELAVLGAVVKTGGHALDDLALVGDDFTDARHGELFDAMRQLRAKGVVVDQVTLAESFPALSTLVWSLSDHTPFAAAAATYAEFVAAHGMRRRLQAVAAGIGQLQPPMSAEQMLERAQELIDSAVGARRVPVRFVADILPDVVSRMESQDLFVPSPWPSLNAVIGGLRPGAVYVIGARPGIGKTVVAAQIAAELSKSGGVAFSSLEMSETELVGRLIAERLSIYVGKVKDGRMTDRDWEVFASRQHEVADLRIAVDDRASVSPTDVRQFARAVKREAGLAGVVVDYLQLMSSTSKQDRHVVVSEFSRQMKILAKDLQVPVVLLSQLNRASESRMDSAPKLSELRESGAIEQDADVVILLSRKETFAGEAIVMDVAKNRHGTTDVVELSWHGSVSRVEEWS